MSRFNPELVTMVPPETEEEEEQVAVITVENLERFVASAQWRSQGFTSILLSGVRRAAMPRRSIAAVQGGYTSGYTSESREPYAYDDGHTFGIRADQALRLLEDLQNGALWIRGFAETSIDRYGEFCDQLHLEDTLQEPATD